MKTTATFYPGASQHETGSFSVCRLLCVCTALATALILMLSLGVGMRSTAGATEAASQYVSVSASGLVSVEVAPEFSNAEVLSVASADASFEVLAVVDNHTLTFYAPGAGDYVLSRTGNDVWSFIDALGTQSYFQQTSGLKVLVVQLDEDSALSIPGVLTSAESSSVDEPIRALAHFLGEGTQPSGSVEMDRRSADALIGYTTGSDNALTSAAAAQTDPEDVEENESVEQVDTDFEATYLLIEDRDENTGSLLASLLFTPDADVAACDVNEGGTQAFNVVLNPSADLLEERLSTHSAYADLEGAAASAAELISSLEAQDGLWVLANLDTMASYSTGEKIYSFNACELLGADVHEGDTLSLVYLAAASDANAYVGNLSAAFESKLLSTNIEVTVDSEGFITFGLYGGGVYLLGETAAVSSAVDEAKAEIEALLATDDTESQAGSESTPVSSETEDPFSLGETTYIDIDTSAISTSDDTEASSAGEQADTEFSGLTWTQFILVLCAILLIDALVMIFVLKRCIKACRDTYDARLATLSRAFSTQDISEGETSEQWVRRVGNVSRYEAGPEIPDGTSAGEALQNATSEGTK